MKTQQAAQFSRLDALGAGDPPAETKHCKICGSPSPMFDIVDFNKICAEDYYPFGFSGITVPYYRCPSCHFIFAEFFDDWTKEDFTTYVYNADYCLIDGEYAAIRPARMAAEMAALLADQRSARILDYGSGTGVFAERLREAGFAAVESYDPFTSPQLPSGEFDVVTCFETIEHSPFPRQTVAELRRFMKPDGCIFFTTGIQPANIAELRANWWYIAPRNGHVSIYTPAALEQLGATAGLEFYLGAGTLAFAGPAPSPQLAPLLRAIGPTQVAVRLSAPADGALVGSAGARNGDWHAIEGSGRSRFRWTQTSRIEWRLADQPMSFPCRLTLTIPFIMEIVPGFAEQCTVEVQSRTYPVRRDEAAITATIDLERRLDRPVALITPEPQRPCDLRGTPDRRPLGLAVLLAGQAG